MGWGDIPLPCWGWKSFPRQVSRGDRQLGDEQTPRGSLNILLLDLSANVHLFQGVPFSGKVTPYSEAQQSWEVS